MLFLVASAASQTTCNTYYSSNGDGPSSDQKLLGLYVLAGIFGGIFLIAAMPRVCSSSLRASNTGCGSFKNCVRTLVGVTDDEGKDVAWCPFIWEQHDYCSLCCVTTATTFNCGCNHVSPDLRLGARFFMLVSKILLGLGTATAFEGAKTSESTTTICTGPGFYSSSSTSTSGSVTNGLGDFFTSENALETLYVALVGLVAFIPFEMLVETFNRISIASGIRIFRRVAIFFCLAVCGAYLGGTVAITGRKGKLFVDVAFVYAVSEFYNFFVLNPLKSFILWVVINCFCRGKNLDVGIKVIDSNFKSNPVYDV